MINECAKRLKKSKGEWRRLAQCYGAITKENVIKADIDESEKGGYSDIPEKYKYILHAPFQISAQCCTEMKKKILHRYGKESGRVPITAQMAEESRLRERQWLKSGCNAFDNNYPISNPMAFWTEQDVLKYINDNEIEIASVYGDIAYLGEDGSMYYDLIDTANAKLCTTRLRRTGCMFCGYGCHIEKGKGRFELMKESHPKQYEYIMKPVSDGGLGYKEVVDWINENGELKIRY